MGFDRQEKLADKCDLCGGDPECVKHCFYGALEFKDPERTVFDMNRSYVNKLKDSYLQEVSKRVQNSMVGQADTFGWIERTQIFR
jgi:Fe-S-cluster-containing dehydrogenase component